MIGDILLSLVFVISLELALANVRKRQQREAITKAYLDGVHAANRVHATIAAIPKSDSRH